MESRSNAMGHKEREKAADEIKRGEKSKDVFGQMYARWTLECIAELAYAVSTDFISRPHLYQRNDRQDDLVYLRMSYGTAPDLPNPQQRLLIHLPVFGRSDGLRPDGGTSHFHATRKKLIDATVAFAERVYETGVQMLEERVRSAVIPIESHLSSLAGRSVMSSNEQCEKLFQLSTRILRSDGVAKVFGVEPAEEGWPLSSEDPNGAKLVEAIGATLRLASDYALTRDRFVLLQRVAREGGEALDRVLLPDPASDENIRTLITKVYAWGTSLRDFQA